MAKRFTDTEKWTKNKWFRTLPKDIKLFWLFILDYCDCVGVWEEDVDFVNTTLDIKLDKETILASLGKRISLINDGKKWWIVDFCNFQYGELKEANIKNKPHQKYISELKKHRLWIAYTKTIHSLEEEDKEEEEEEEIEGGTGETKPVIIPIDNTSPNAPKKEELYEVFFRNGSTNEQADNFYNHYNALGWKIGMTDILHWKSLVPKWLANVRPPKDTKSDSKSIDQRILTHIKK